MALTAIAPVLLVKDIKKSVQFWEEKAGFTAAVPEGYPTTAFVSRDGIRIMLIQHGEGGVPNWKIASATNQVYIWTDAVDDLYAEMQERGAQIDFTLYNTPWKTREFGIQCPDEYDIAFGQGL